jgi:cytochrome c oxidase cbb3-type subunit 3
MNINKANKITGVSLSLLFLSRLTSAQAVASSEDSGAISNMLNWVLNNFVIVLSVLVIIGAGVTLLKLITMLFDLQRMRMLEDMGVEVMKEANLLEEKGIFEKFSDWMWSIVPVTQEQKIDLGHDYDGIRELDNRLPPWWLLLFYGSIAFGGFYMYYYHWSGTDWSTAKEYEVAMEEAEIQKATYLDRMSNLVDENSVTYLSDAQSLAEGAEIFKMNCLACHGALGEGGVGPNLTDQYWVHGGGMSNIFKTIKYGVPEKGMISWKEQLKPVAMQKVSSFIMTLEGTNPPNQKASEGEIWVENGENGNGGKTLDAGM